MAKNGVESPTCLLQERQGLGEPTIVVGRAEGFIARYVARLLEAVGTDRVVTLDVHNRAAFENAFRCAIDHLEATRLFVEQRQVRTSPQHVVQQREQSAQREHRLRRGRRARGMKA